MSETIHMLKERKGASITVKCGAPVRNIKQASVWWTDVTCVRCFVRQEFWPENQQQQPKPKKYLRKKK